MVYRHILSFCTWASSHYSDFRLARAHNLLCHALQLVHSRLRSGGGFQGTVCIYIYIYTVLYLKSEIQTGGDVKLWIQFALPQLIWEWPKNNDCYTYNSLTIIITTHHLIHIHNREHKSRCRWGVCEHVHTQRIFQLPLAAQEPTASSREAHATH